ncbi:MAG: hypothetical protein NVSMB62_27140 [Acidobacteriaceae bacterium]
MTNDILRLRDALNRVTEESGLRQTLQRNSGAIRDSLTRCGEYRLPTRRGTIVIRSPKKTA